MPTNNFKLFDENKANMMTDDDYAINQQRLNGVQSGVASSQLQNKTLYQTALMCYALAQLMAANGYDANDANAVSTFVNNLSLSMVQKVVDKASANDVANQTAGKWVDAKQLGELKKDVADNYLPLLGGTMLGDLLLNRDPISSLQAATKQYVDKFAKIEIHQIPTVDLTSENNPVILNFQNKPKLFIPPVSVRTLNNSLSNISPSIMFTDLLDTSYRVIGEIGSGGSKYSLWGKISSDGLTINIYSNNITIITSETEIMYYAGIYFK